MLCWQQNHPAFVLLWPPDAPKGEKSPALLALQRFRDLYGNTDHVTVKGIITFHMDDKKTRVSFYVSPSVCSAKSKPEASVCEGGGHAYFSSPGLCITHRDHSAHLNTVCPRTHV